MIRRRPWWVAYAAALSALAGCASLVGPTGLVDVSDLRRGALDGDRKAARQLAAVIASGRAADGTLKEAWDALGAIQPPDQADRVLRGEVAAALGQPQDAFDTWLATLSKRPWADASAAGLGEFAALRALAHVDTVALTQRHVAWLQDALAGSTPPLAAADLARAVALRVGSAGLADRARRAAGWIQTYHRTGRLAPEHGSGGDSSHGWSGPVSTPDGSIALPDDGPGSYGVRIPIPAGKEPIQVHVTSQASYRAFVAGAAVGSYDRVSPYGSTWSTFPLAAGPVRSLELRLDSSVSAPTLVVAVRPGDPVTAEPTQSRLAHRLATLELALARRDVALATAAADHLAPDARGIASMALARFHVGDMSRPGGVTEPAARALLRGSLATLPDHAAARVDLARRHLDAGEASKAEALLSAREVGAFADPLRVDLARELRRPHEAARIASALVERLPTSCSAHELLLDTRWDQARLQPEILPENHPSCLDHRLRLAELLHEAWRLGQAAKILRQATKGAPPGSARARVLLALARVLSAAGDPAEAAEHAEAGLEEGVLRAELLAWLAGEGPTAGVTWQQRMLSTPGLPSEARSPFFDPKRELGLPLTDVPSLLEAMEAPDPGSGVGGRPSVTVLLDEHHARVLPDGMQVHRAHRIFAVHEESAAEDWGEIPLPDGAELLVARTWALDGEGDWGARETEDIVATGSVSLPAMAEGTVGEVAFFWVEPRDEDLAPQWALPTFQFESFDAAVTLARLRVVSEPGTPLWIAALGDLPQPSRPQDGVLLWETRDRPQRHAEPLDPRPDRRLASVRVTGGPAPGLTLGAWRDRQRFRVIRHTASSPTIARFVASALEGVDDAPRHRLRALHTAVTTGIQETDEGLWGVSASFAAARRSGHRALLLVSACRQAGLHCELVLARPHSRGVGIPPGQPADPQDWVYPVVLAHLPSGDRWLDVSSAFVPFGLLPPLVQNVDGLRLAAGLPTLTTPVGTRDGQRRVDVRIQVHDNGTFEARGDEHLTGLFAMGWRHVVADMLPRDRDRALAGLIRQSLPGCEVDEVTLLHAASRDTPLRFLWRATGSLTPAQSGQALDVALSPEHLTRSTVKVPHRDHPLFVAQTVDLDMRVIVTLPTSWRLHLIPVDEGVEGPLISYGRTAAWDARAGALTLHKTCRIRTGIIDPGQYPSWVAAARTVDRADALHLVLVPGPTR